MLLRPGKLFVMNVLLVALLIIVSGCATFPGNNLPSRSQADIAPTSKLGSIGFDAKWYFRSTLNPGISSLFRERVREDLRESSLFSDVTADCSAESACLEFTMTSDGTTGFFWRLLAGFSGATLTILPAYARDDYTMTVDLKQDGELLRTYEYKESMRTWIQLFMVFFSGYTTTEAFDEVQDKIFWNFIYDFQKDALLSSSPSMTNR